MPQPTLLVINGPPGAGKTTLASRYVEEHPLALLVSEDDLIGAMGQWIVHEEEGRELAFSHVQSMTALHLSAGHDVVVPILLTQVTAADALAHIAARNNARYMECVVAITKQESVTRMLQRGTWGEPGSPPVTELDTPTIEKLFDTFQSVATERKQASHITSLDNDIEGTYAQIKALL